MLSLERGIEKLEHRSALVSHRDRSSTKLYCQIPPEGYFKEKLAPRICMRKHATQIGGMSCELLACKHDADLGLGGRCAPNQI